MGEKILRMSDIKENPLDIENVVENVVSNLPDEEVKNCRLVCKMWLKESNRVLKSRDFVTIKSDQDIKDIFERFNLNPKYWISKLMLQQFPEEIPLLLELMRKVKSQLSKLMIGLEIAPNEKNQQSYEDVIRLLGENVVQLVLGDSSKMDPKFESIEFLKYLPVRDLKSGELLVFPNVKYLKFLSSNIPVSNSSLLSSAARMFPNLEQLDINYLALEKPSNFDKIRMQHLRRLKIDQNPMDIPDNLARSTPGLEKNNVKCLLKLDLNLKDLIIQNVHCCLSSELFKEFLESHKNLERLRLSHRSCRLQINTPNNVQNIYFSVRPPCPFPLSLSTLTTLNLMKDFVMNLNHVFFSCPKVEKIYFSFNEISDWKGILPGGNLTPPDTLKNLHFYFIDLVSLKKFGSSVLSEQITELCLNNCNDAILRVVFEKFLNLKILTVFDKSEKKEDGDLMTDAGFSGLSQEMLDRFENDKEGFEKQLDELRIHPHIGNLKELTRFGVELSSLSPIKWIPLWGICSLSKLSNVSFKGKKIDIDGLLDCFCVGEDLIEVSDSIGCHYSILKKDSDIGQEFLIKKMIEKGY